MSVCLVCPLNNTTTKVEGWGKKDAKILIIAEAPGAEEEKRGIPLLGRAGNLFNNILKSAGIKRSDLFIINSILCRPPKNNIKSSEAQAALKICPYNNVFPVIKQVSPKVIISLGNTPHKVFFGTEGIKSQRGKLKNWNGFKVIPTLHPAYLLRGNMHLFDTVVKDFKVAKSIAEEEETNIKTILVDTVEAFDKLIENLSKCKKIAFDVEATGIDVRNDKIIGCSFAMDENTGYYIVLRERTVIGDKLEWSWKDPKYIIAGLKSVLEDKTIVKAIHNASYDYQIVKNDLGIVINKFVDSLIPPQLINENTSNKLKDLIKVYPDLAGYDNDLINMKNRLKIKDYSYISKEILSIYGAKDAIACFRIMNKYINEIKKDEKLFNYYKKFKKPLTLPLIEMEEFGLRVDRKQLDKLRDKYKEELEKLTKEIYNDAGYKFNINSDEQLGDLLYNKMKLPVLKRSQKTNKPSVDKEVLKELLNRTQEPLLEKIREYNIKNKIYTTYLIGMADLIDEDGVVHSHFSQTTTVTGRLSSRNPNCQNIVGNKDVLDLFVANDGYTFIYGDLKQAEIRGAAAISKDKRLLETCLGKDIYCDLGSLMFKKPIKKGDEERQISKTLILATMYQMGIKSLAKTLRLSTNRVVTEAEAKEYQTIFFNICKDLKAWIAKTIRFAKRNEYVRNPFGRIRHLPYINSNNSELAAFSERAAVNSPIQSMIADIINYNLCRVRKYFLDNQIPARVVLQVHDMLMVECRDDYVQEVIPKFKELITMNVEPVKVPLSADIKVGKKWGSLQDVN